jgi:SpoIID/LytB domain protein
MEQATVEAIVYNHPGLSKAKRALDGGNLPAAFEDLEKHVDLFPAETKVYKPHIGQVYHVRNATFECFYTQEELTELVNRKTKLDLGDIVDLIPLDRGTSGRIWRLQLVGTKRSFIIGKELEIRRALSETHLYSSAFDVEKRDNRFILHGRGWGHGVGLCQIGAAVMGEKGYDYDDILLYYYRGAEIKQIY